MVQESLFREWCGLALDKDRHIFRIGTVWLMTNASLISHLWIACLAHDLGSPRDVYFISNKLTLFFIARSEYFSSLWAMHFPTEKQFLFYLSSKKVWYDIHPCTSINSSQESKAVGFSSVCNQLLMWPLPRRFIAHIVLCWILKVTAHQYIMRDFFLCVWLFRTRMQTTRKARQLEKVEISLTVTVQTLNFTSQHSARGRSAVNPCWLPTLAIFLNYLIGF